MIRFIFFFNTEISEIGPKKMALGSEDDEEHGLMALSRGLDYEQKGP